jgi:hypothetical protein
MNSIGALMVGIVVERLVIVLLGGVSVILGWALFRQQLSNDGQAEISHLGFHVVLRRIGPGVFFALFGAAVLSFALARPVSVEVTQSPSLSDVLVKQVNQDPEQNGRPTPNVTAHVKFSGAAGSGDSGAARTNVRALNTALRLSSIDRKDPRVMGAALDDLTKASAPLSQLRDQIVGAEIGQDAVDLWKRKGKEFNSNPRGLARVEREQLEKMAGWFTETEAGHN